jgi:hypothetical protein
MPMSSGSHREWLARAFPQLGEPLLSETAEALREIRVAPGQVIIRRGDAADVFYIITSGKVGVTREGRSGSESTVATLGPGQFFGEMSLLEDSTRTANVFAQTRVELLALDREHFVRLIERTGLGAEVGPTAPADDEAPPVAVPKDYWHVTWANAVRTACHGLLAAHGSVRSIDLVGSVRESGNPLELLQLADIARRTAQEFGLEVRVSYDRERPILRVAMNPLG